ncbi:pyridoxamine 5'-phosphate oxidase family protein [Bacteroidota bacterium]
MKKLYVPLSIILLVSSVIAQENKFFVPEEIPKDSLLTLAQTIIKSAQSQTLITVDEDGKPQARIMSRFLPDENMVIWLGTRPGSRKVKQIKTNPNVMVFYYDTKGFSYVSVAGQARIVNDAEKKKQYWKKGWEKYYPDPDKDYILIEVTPERIEMVSYKYDLFWNANGKPHSIEF